MWMNANSQISKTKSISLNQIDTYINTIMAGNGISGLAANIVVDNETVWSSEYGLADRSANQEVDSHTSFLWYSMTKTITGVALIQLLDNKGLSIDDPIHDFLDFTVRHPNHSSVDISFKMLMSHVSGILDDWTVINQVMTYGTDSSLGLGDFLKSYLSQGGEYYKTGNFGKSPGTAFSYSNIGAGLAGYLIERISGVSYQKYIKDNLLTPLGMNDSHFMQAEMDVDKLAVRYRGQAANFQASGHIGSPLLPAGFLHSTNADMQKWLKFVLNDGKLGDQQIINPGRIEFLTTSSYPELEVKTGLLMAYDPLYEVWGHTGGIEGRVMTCYFFNKKENWGISVMTNGHGDPYPIFYFLMQVAREFEKISICEVDIQDENGNGIIEANESTRFGLSFRNNLQGRVDPLTVELSSSNLDIQILEGTAQLSASTGNMELAADQEFLIQYTGNEELEDLPLLLDLSNGNDFSVRVSLQLPYGLRHTLLVHDEEHAQKNVANSIEYYESVFDELNIGHTYYDMSTLGIPQLSTLQAYETVYWMTGLDNANQEILSEDERDILKAYLDQGGKLFICGQNINDVIGETEFFSNYLHASSSVDSWTGNLRINGVSSTTLGDGISFSLNGGDSNSTQYSPSAVNPDDQAQSFLKYFQSNQSCGISFEGDYKLIYLTFGLEGINNSEMARELVKRSEEFFMDNTGIQTCKVPDVRVFPSPFMNDLYIEIDAADNSSSTVCLWDINGQELYSMSVRDKGGMINLGRFVNLSNLSKGLYFVRIEGSNMQVIRKVVKL